MTVSKPRIKVQKITDEHIGLVDEPSKRKKRRYLNSDTATTGSSHPESCQTFPNMLQSSWTEMAGGPKSV